MRWYKIVVGGSNGLTFDATGDPNALQVEMDIVQGGEHAPAGGAASVVKVFGIPLKMLLNSRQYIGQSIQVFGGMQKGLPLANPAQQGLLIEGQVNPVLGNWINTDMTMDFYIKAGVGIAAPRGAANIIHNWPAGTPLATAMKQTLSTAFPKLTPVINISPKLVLNYPDQGFYETLLQYGSYMNQISHSIMAGMTGYQGVFIHINGKKIIAQDGTQPSNTKKKINYQDMVGQPIWTGLKTIQLKLVMRGDFDLGDEITIPPTLATLSGGLGNVTSNLPSNIIQGKFQIAGTPGAIRHVGNFRNPNWDSWITVINAVQP